MTKVTAELCYACDKYTAKADKCPYCGHDEYYDEKVSENQLRGFKSGITRLSGRGRRSKKPAGKRVPRMVKTPMQYGPAKAGQYAFLVEAVKAYLPAPHHFITLPGGRAEFENMAVKEFGDDIRLTCIEKDLETFKSTKENMNGAAKKATLIHDNLESGEFRKGSADFPKLCEDANFVWLDFMGSFSLSYINTIEMILSKSKHARIIVSITIGQRARGGLESTDPVEWISKQAEVHSWNSYVLQSSKYRRIGHSQDMYFYSFLFTHSLRDQQAMIEMPEALLDVEDIEAVMLRLNLTPSQLAQKLGCTQNAIYGWVHKRSKMSAKLQGKLRRLVANTPTDGAVQPVTERSKLEPCKPKHIKAVLEELGLSVIQLAKHLEISPSAVYLWLRGQCKMSLRAQRRWDVVINSLRNLPHEAKPLEIRRKRRGRKTGYKNQYYKLYTESGLTYQEVADKVGVHKSCIGVWLSGKRKPKGDYRKKLLKVLRG